MVHVLDVKHVDAGALLMVVVVPAFHASLFNFIKGNATTYFRLPVPLRQ